MQINIILPYKEQFSKNKASSVSITVKNNFENSMYKNCIKIFGQNVDFPIFPKNFIGIKKPLNFFKSKNKHLAEKMCEIIKKDYNQNHLVEVHNRPYLVKLIDKKLEKKSIILFFHNNPLAMKGSKTIKERLELLSRVNYICCVSRFVKKQFLKGIENKEKKVVVIHNGVLRSLEKFPQKKKEIIFVGRIVKEKGVHLFVDAIKDVYSELNEWSFKIIGSVKLGNNIHYNNYSKQVIENFDSLGERTEFKGYLSQIKLSKILKDASIIVIPSLWKEPFGLVAAEAMANGIAVISSRSGGLEEIVNKNGILIDNIDTKKIVSSILKLTRYKDQLLKYQKLSWENHKFTSKSSSVKLDELRKSIIFK